MVFDRFAGVDADPNAQALGSIGVESGKASLNVGGAAHGIRNVGKGGHDAIASMLDFASAIPGEPAPD